MMMHLRGYIRISAFRAMLLLLCWEVVFSPLICQAGPVNIPGFYGPVIMPPQRTQLPVLKQPSVTIPGISGFETNPSENRLTILQNQPQAIIDWESFDIGADAWTHFDQQGNSSWVALNRIWDRNPSRIYGRLTADGKIYLINQNGILFGPGSRINVNSLIGSALNITNDDFIRNALKFRFDNYRVTEDTEAVLNPLASVSNHGEINAATGGSVFLMAPRVENSGTINAKMGQIGLAAGTQMELNVDSSESGTRTALIVNVTDGFGEAVNMEGGQLIADMGLAGMYGGVVNQEGLIRSVTAVKMNGQIELIARDKIITGSNSRIESPVSDSPDKVDNSFQFSGGVVVMHGNFENPSDPSGNPPALIEHRGVIDAPSGHVTMTADQRVFLEKGSRINAGGVWSNQAAASNAVEAQLNSVELRDAYGQKEGVLKGETITTNTLTGSSIGNISGVIHAQETTAQEKGIHGGTINVTVNSGDIIVKQGAVLDFSGGGIRYSGGMVDATKLLSGTKIYDISNAPLNIEYDRVMGQYKKTYDRFGITESYSGIYYGGASPLKTYVNSFTRGGNAGSLTLTAPVVVLEGQLNGSVTQGLFQTAVTPYDPAPLSARSLSVARGLEIPTGGILTIGMGPAGEVFSMDLSVKEIAVRQNTVPLPEDFSSGQPLEYEQTVLSSDILNEAGLGGLGLYANTRITTEAGAHILMLPGGTFTAYARRIEHSGDIRVPAGAINLTVSDNKTTFAQDVPMEERIYLAPGSRLDVSGKRIDNSLAGKVAGFPLGFGQTGGGTISIKDQTDHGQGVFMETGVIVDVSGGYTINQKGKVTGGNAGKLNIQGSTIMLEGDLRGYALADPNGKIQGGAITLRAGNVLLAQTSPSWTDFKAESDVLQDDDTRKGWLTLAGNRFDDTGFTRITLESFNDVVVDPDTVFSTSLVRLNQPVPALRPGVAVPIKATANGGSIIHGREDLFRLDDSMAFRAGASSFTAVAGKVFDGSYPDATGNLVNTSNINAKMNISPGSVIHTAPEGTIALTAPMAVEMAGTLDTPGGKITITTLAIGELAIRDGGRILAGGYNRPDTATVVPGFGVNYSSRSGGEVNLSAYNNLDLEEGSFIDISGSGAVVNRIRSHDGKITTYREAGDPGSLYLSFSGSLTWEGGVNAHHDAKMAGIKGGTLTVSQGNSLLLDISTGDVGRYLAAGFDDVTLKSKGVLQFSGTIDAVVGRKLTLDAREISVSDLEKMLLRAPWIVLANTFDTLPAGSANIGDGRLTLSGGWIDLNGSIKMNGLKEVRLEAERDIRLTDRVYSAGSGKVSEGKLAAAGDLILKADRIYPTTLSQFTIQSTEGKVTILPAEEAVGGLIFSAGGNLAVEAAKGIDVRGTLAAPVGTVSLRGTAAGSRIYLANGSLVTTAGNAMVNYGEIDDSNAWFVPDKADSNKTSPMDSALQKAVTINANTGEVIVSSDAVIDASGGGSVFAYHFQAGIEGTDNPLTKTGRYLIMSDHSVQLPGESIYMTGGGDIGEGLYTLLDISKNPPYAQYAFLPGAYILEVQSGNIIPGPKSLTNYGYPVVAGYASVTDTEIRKTRPTLYSVRTAADVMTEGHFDTQTLTAGDAGGMTIKGSTTIIDGVLRAAAMDGYLGGSVALSGKNVIVQSSVTTPLPSNFDFNSPVPGALKDKLTVTADSLSGKGFREVSLGYLNLQNQNDQMNTDTVTIKSGAILEAPVISLTAKQQITVEDLSELRALTQKTRDSGEGVIHLNTPGSLLVRSGSVVHSSHTISLDVNNVQDLQGNLKVDNSAISLKGTAIFFGDRGMSAADGLYLTKTVWDTFTQFEDITLVAGYTDGDAKFVSTQIQFKDSFDLSATGSLTLDAAQILGLKTGGTNVNLNAPSVNLRNSGDRSKISTMVPANAGTFTVNASNAINVGGGDVLFGGFGTIALNSPGDVILKGHGSLATGNADLQISSARVTTGAAYQTDGTYLVAGFRVVAGINKNDLNPAHSITMTAPLNSQPGAVAGAYGGRLEFAARKIELSTVLQSDAGTIKLTSTGAGAMDGIFLKDGARVIARGTDDAPGGRINLQADNGIIALEENSIIDVSAGYTLQGDGTLISQGDAGVVTLGATKGTVVINGELKGNGINQGRGGSAVLDAYELTSSDITHLTDVFQTGGFTESLDLRARTGDVAITSDVRSNHFRLTADSGAINVYATIDASAVTGDGGKIGLYANNDLTIHETGKISAHGTSGGEVTLSSAGGWVRVNEGGTIDVSGGTDGKGGMIYLRALRSSEAADDTNIRLNGILAGQDSVFAEAFWVYDNVGTINSTVFNKWNSKNNTFMANAAAIKENILPDGSSKSWFHLLPGIEVRNTSDISLGAAWDLTSWRYAGEPGVLTIRAGSNFNINSSLVDHPTPLSSLPASTPGRDSWAFNLIAGADTDSADYLAVVHGKGDLTIKDEKVVYTESAPIRFASGKDTLIGKGQGTSPGYMINTLMYYNLASYDGSIGGWSGQDLQIDGGAIQTATGDIDITVGGNLNFLNKTVQGINTLGAIRTTGRATAGGQAAARYWTYSGGGDIHLDVGGNVGKKTSEGWTTAVSAINDQWDRAYVTNRTTKDTTWAAGYETSSSLKVTVTTGLAAMGGGNLIVRTGGDFLTQAGTFGRNDEGSLKVYAGGDIRGRFLNADGQMDLHAMGNFGTANERQVIEAFDSRMSVTALGDIELATVLNPIAASASFPDMDLPNGIPNQSWHIGYSETASVSLKAGGNVTYAGDSPFHITTAFNIKRERIMPASLTVQAGGDIRLMADLALLPSSKGNLSLAAGGSIDGQYFNAQGQPQRAQIFVSDMAPADVYSDTAQSSIVANLFFRDAHAVSPVHEGDAVPIGIRAGQDVKNLKLFLPKKAEVVAEKGDIRDIFYYGQNVSANDASQIRAKQGDIFFSINENSDDTGVVQAGPGSLIIQGSGSISLGNSRGIQAVGNAFNPLLGSQGSALVIMSGYNQDISATDAGTFFDELRKAGTDYSTLMAGGNKDQADQVIRQTRAEIIEPRLGVPAGSGNINMTTSQISTISGKNNLFIIANGQLDVGKSTFFNSETERQATGIFTAGGGAVNIFAAGDVNVNESRVMTFFGGDITVWSDRGNVNAGRGSKTEVSAAPPEKVPVYDDNKQKIGYKMEFTPPAVGSGIRAVTFDSDGAAGPLQAPPAGDIYLFAARGAIDAGEAGISGGKIVLGATEVFNVANINFSAGSIGVPQATTGTASIGSLSGAGTVTAGTSRLSQDAGGISSNTGRTSQMIEDIIAMWLDVKVVDFIQDQE